MQAGQVRSGAAVSSWAVVLIGLLPGLILKELDVRLGAALAVQCVVVAHAGGALARVLTATTVRLVAFGFWLFAYVWLGLAPLAMLATDQYPLGYRAGESAAFTAAVLIEVGLLAYTAGATLAARHAKDRSVVLEAVLSRRIAPLPVILLCGLVFVLAIALIPQQGGLTALFTSRQAVREAGGGGSADSVSRALVAWSLAVPAFWALLALVHLPLLRDGDRLLRGVRWMLLPLLLALNVVVNNPISKPRFWAGTVLLTLLFASSRMCRPRAFRITAAALVATVLLVFPYSDYFRYDERRAVNVVSVAEQFTSNMDYDGFQQMQTGIDYAEDSGFSPSRFLGPVLFVVPRSAWPDKPQDSGVQLAQFAGYRFHNLSAPLWIESYLWAGFPSVIAVFLLLGAVGRRMDDIRSRLPGGYGTLAVLLVPAFAIYQMVLLRGSLMGIAGPLFLLMTIPFFITTRAARTPRFSSAAVPAGTAGHATISGTGGHP
ncbi:hypothetical protein NLX86_17015 [Streptomyces sp. A3M-1-3]|uniref:hypothetical protein n=1 Tax=Streptomyces sp. A3M-1-3 TaxID=2962044 RepID=UPI0020B89236|nr:hypothetical protein [Streptomyces sp. A3M-1-3]MCP3819737.1 hypothetical protein [Streptomyces sp. A3M-1-3]